MKSLLLEKIPSIHYAFGNHAQPWGGLESDAERRPVWKQVHGVALAWVEAPAQNCGEVDGLFTQEKQIAVGVATADCVPILLARHDGTSIGALHSGWRGTLAGMVETAVQFLALRGQKIRDWRAVIGPAARACCYEVGDEVLASFRARWEGTGIPSEQWNPRPRMLNLQALNAYELQRLGCEAVEVIPLCTICHTEFASHRRGSTQGGQAAQPNRQYSAIMKV